MISGKISSAISTCCRLVSMLFLLAIAACKAPLVEPEAEMPSAQGKELIYPLNMPQFPGYSGDFILRKLNDATASGELHLSGLQNGYRYFGKISRTSSANPNLVTDFADLGEIQTSNPTLLTHLKKDYQNKEIRFDSLTEMEAVIRILELSPSGGFPREVLRGDFGSNLILDGGKSVAVTGVGNSGIGGSLLFRQRRNGKLLVSGNITGLSGSETLELSNFSGSPNASFIRKEKIGQISAENASSFSFGFQEQLDNLSALDTLTGFIGFERPGHSPDSTDFLAIANFGGNLASGNKHVFPVYSSTDSTIKGIIELAEFGPAGSPLRILFKASPGFSVNNAFFSVHHGTTLDASDTIFSVKIPASGQFELRQIPAGNGTLLRYSDVSNWNAHIRIAENDPLGESNLMAKADIGANEVLQGDSVISYLNEQNPSFNIGGFVIFRQRKNGQVLSFFQLGSTQSGVENQILIRTGPKPSAIYDTTALKFRVAGFNGINPGLYKGSSKFLKKDGQPGTWSELIQAKSEGSYLEYSFSDAGDFQVISRGDL